MAVTLTDREKQLLAFIKRRHPEYASNVEQWNFLEATYAGGREWFAPNIFPYHKEGTEEYAARLKRAYRFNHTREVVDLIQKYIFKGTVARNEDDATAELKAFWQDVTLSGLDINQFMMLSSALSSIYGLVWIFTDTNLTAATTPAAPVTVKQATESGARVYSYIVKPQDALDIGFAEDGSINWFLVRELKRDDTDPIASTGDITEQFRLWRKDSWELYEITGKGEDAKVVLVDTDVNKLGIVPCFAVAHVIGEWTYTAPGLINDIAYLDRAVANYLSNLDAIIQDQTFSQLVIPAQGLEHGGDPHKQVLEMGTKRVFTYDGEGGAAPEFISPDSKQAAMIIAAINKIIGEIYHTIGMAGERTKQDNAVGIDNSSGVAKAFDFDRVNSLLVAKAGSLENAENKLANMVSRYNSQKPPVKELVKYPSTFDIRSLFDEFTVAEKLTLIDGPEGVRRAQMKQIITKLFPGMKSADLEALIASTSSWPPKPDPLATAAPPGAARKLKAPATKRQGQVTKTTK